MTEWTVELQAMQAARACLNLFLNVKETNVCMPYNICYVGVTFWGYTDFSLLSDFCVLNGWKRDDYSTLSWQIVAAFGCVTSCVMLHWQLSLAIARCSIALGIHMNLKILYSQCFHANKLILS